MNPKIKNNNDRTYLYQNMSRGGMWYMREFKDGKIIKNKSLGTKDEKEAHELATLKQSVLSLSNSHAAKIAKVYQDQAGEEYVNRTWSDCFDAFNDPRIKSESSIRTYKSHWQHPVFDSIKDRKIADTNPSDLSNILKSATASGRNMMLMLHKFALDNHYAFQSLITKTTKDATKRMLGDTTATLEKEEYKLILEAIDENIDKPRKNQNSELTKEFRDWIVLLWHVGGSSKDMASLTTDNVDWDNGNIVYYREKHRGTKTGMGQKKREPVDFPMGETLKALILKRMNIAGIEGHKQLFPKMNNMSVESRLKMFNRSLKYAGIPKSKIERDGVERVLKIHSFRFAVACRMAETNVITLRIAQYYLGHNCPAVAHYYAGRASVEMESLEAIEARAEADKNAKTKVA
jgi:integrase